jgi:hypothetical protein
MKETKNQCIEIVFFQFDPVQTVAQQQGNIKLMESWITKQPGFVSRTCYFDESQNQWVDCVTWDSLSGAEKAMTNSMKEPTLEPVLGAINMATFRVGHYSVFR